MSYVTIFSLPYILVMLPHKNISILRDNFGGSPKHVRYNSKNFSKNSHRFPNYIKTRKKES